MCATMNVLTAVTIMCIFTPTTALMTQMKTNASAGGPTRRQCKDKFGMCLYPCTCVRLLHFGEMYSTHQTKWIAGGSYIEDVRVDEDVDTKLSEVDRVKNARRKDGWYRQKANRKNAKPIEIHCTYDSFDCATPPCPCKMIERAGGLKNVACAVYKLKKKAVEANYQPIVTYGGDVLGPDYVSNHYTVGWHMVEAMNLLEVDIMVYGNHDFDYGARIAMANMRCSRFAWLAANVKELYKDPSSFVNDYLSEGGVLGSNYVRYGQDWSPKKSVLDGKDFPYQPPNGLFEVRIDSQIGALKRPGVKLCFSGITNKQAATLNYYQSPLPVQATRVLPKTIFSYGWSPSHLDGTDSNTVEAFLEACPLRLASGKTKEDQAQMKSIMNPYEEDKDEYALYYKKAEERTPGWMPKTDEVVRPQEEDRRLKYVVGRVNNGNIPVYNNDPRQKRRAKAMMDAYRAHQVETRETQAKRRSSKPGDDISAQFYDFGELTDAGERLTPAQVRARGSMPPHVQRYLAEERRSARDEDISDLFLDLGEDIGEGRRSQLDEDISNHFLDLGEDIEISPHHARTYATEDNHARAMTYRREEDTRPTRESRYMVPSNGHVASKNGGKNGGRSLPYHHFPGVFPTSILQLGPPPLSHTEKLDNLDGLKKKDERFKKMAKSWTTRRDLFDIRQKAFKGRNSKLKDDEIFSREVDSLFEHFTDPPFVLPSLLNEAYAAGCHSFVLLTHQRFDADLLMYRLAHDHDHGDMLTAIVGGHDRQPHVYFKGIGTKRPADATNVADITKNWQQKYAEELIVKPGDNGQVIAIVDINFLTQVTEPPQRDTTVFDFSAPERPSGLQITNSRDDCKNEMVKSFGRMSVYSKVEGFMETVKMLTEFDRIQIAGEWVGDYNTRDLSYRQTRAGDFYADHIREWAADLYATVRAAAGDMHLVAVTHSGELYSRTKETDTYPVESPFFSMLEVKKEFTSTSHRRVDLVLWAMSAQDFVLATVLSVANQLGDVFPVMAGADFTMEAELHAARLTYIRRVSRFARSRQAELRFGQDKKQSGLQSVIHLTLWNDKPDDEYLMDIVKPQESLLVAGTGSTRSAMKLMVDDAWRVIEAFAETERKIRGKDAEKAGTAGFQDIYGKLLNDFEDKKGVTKFSKEATLGDVIMAVQLRREESKSKTLPEIIAGPPMVFDDEECSDINGEYYGCLIDRDVSGIGASSEYPTEIEPMIFERKVTKITKKMISSSGVVPKQIINRFSHCGDLVGDKCECPKKMEGGVVVTEKCALFEDIKSGPECMNPDVRTIQILGSWSAAAKSIQRPCTRVRRANYDKPATDEPPAKKDEPEDEDETQETQDQADKRILKAATTLQKWARKYIFSRQEAHWRQVVLDKAGTSMWCMQALPWRDVIRAVDLRNWHKELRIGISEAQIVQNTKRIVQDSKFMAKIRARRAAKAQTNKEIPLQDKLDAMDEQFKQLAARKSELEAEALKHNADDE